MEKITKITESTFIPISFVMSLVGGVFWMTMIYSQSNATAADQKEMKADHAAFAQAMAEKQDLMLDRLSRIEGRLETIQHRR